MLVCSSCRAEQLEDSVRCESCGASLAPRPMGQGARRQHGQLTQGADLRFKEHKPASPFKRIVVAWLVLAGLGVAVVSAIKPSSEGAAQARLDRAATAVATLMDDGDTSNVLQVVGIAAREANCGFAYPFVYPVQEAPSSGMGLGGSVGQDPVQTILDGVKRAMRPDLVASHLVAAGSQIVVIAAWSCE